MKTQNINESAAAGKAGEPTAVAEPKSFTAASVTDLLKSEFAQAATAEPEAAGQEIPPADAEAAASPDDPEKEEQIETPGEAATPEAATAEAEAAAGAEAAAEGVEPGAEHDSPAEELPAAMAEELTAWEEKGGPLPPALQAVVGKRIGKLTAARETEKTRADAAEAKLTALTAELEQLKADPNRPANPAPVAAMTPKAVSELAATSNKMVSEMENYLDGTATDEERGRVERYMESKRLDQNGLKRELRELNRFVTQELPTIRQQAQDFAAQEAAATPVAKQAFPFLDDKASPAFAKAQQVLNLLPEMQSRTPAHRLAVGTYVLGLEVMDALQAAGHTGDVLAAVLPALRKAFPAKGTVPAPAKTKMPPPKTPAAGGSAPVKVKTTPVDTARAQFNRIPDRQSATELARQALRAG